MPRETFQLDRRHNHEDDGLGRVRRGGEGTPSSVLSSSHPATTPFNPFGHECNELARVVSIAYRVVDLDSERKCGFAVFAGVFSNGENGTEVGAVAKNVDVESGEIHPRQTGYRKTVVWLIRFGEHTFCYAILFHIGQIRRIEGRKIRRIRRP